MYSRCSSVYCWPNCNHKWKCVLVEMLYYQNILIHKPKKGNMVTSNLNNEGAFSLLSFLLPTSIFAPDLSNTPEDFSPDCIPSNSSHPPKLVVPLLNSLEKISSSTRDPAPEFPFLVFQFRSLPCTSFPVLLTAFDDLFLLLLLLLFKVWTLDLVRFLPDNRLYARVTADCPRGSAIAIRNAFGPVASSRESRIAGSAQP